MNKKIVILVPIYRSYLTDLEFFSLKYSLNQLKSNFEIYFITPDSLNTIFYEFNFPFLKYKKFNDAYFLSTTSYSRLLLSPVFYEAFDDFEFLLILQTDAIILSDQLNFWVDQQFDYIGAPWPNGFSFNIAWDKFRGDNSKLVKVHVGNGGLSLRRIKSCVNLIKEFPEAHDYFYNSGSHEDFFFSFMGILSDNFIIPDEIVACKFSLELEPTRYANKDNYIVPMGGHAWSKYDLNFWLNNFDPIHKKYIVEVLLAPSNK
jgi:hypothetical protein